WKYLGPAVPVRTGHDPRGAHARGARAQAATARCSRNLSAHGERSMETRIEVGILGATGMVGQHFINFLQGHPWFDVTWLGASDRSAGKKYRDACGWRLDGVTPANVADQLVHDCKPGNRSEEHTSELQSRENLVCRLLL